MKDSWDFPDNDRDCFVVQMRRKHPEHPERIFLDIKTILYTAVSSLTP